MTVYINLRGAEGVETVDEFETRKEAREALGEYLRLSGGDYYISSRSTREWREASRAVDIAL